MGAMRPLTFLFFLATATLTLAEVEYCKVYTYISNGVVDCSGNCYAHGSDGVYIKSGGLRQSCESGRRVVNCNLNIGNCVCCIST